MRFSAGFLRALALPVVLAWCVSCARARSEPAHGTIRLVGLFKPEMVSGTVTATETRVPRTEWRFDKAAPAVADVDGAAVRDGRFAGRATSDFPMFSVERTSDLDNRDQVHAVEIRMRASAGANVRSVVICGPPRLARLVAAQRSSGHHRILGFASDSVAGHAGWRHAARRYLRARRHAPRRSSRRLWLRA